MEYLQFFKCWQYILQSCGVMTDCSYSCKELIDCEKVKAYFLKLMMPTDDNEYERVERVYIQLFHGLMECPDEDE